MRDLLDFVKWALLIVLWVCGVVLAKGFWSTLFAICLPFWGWYLVTERVLAAFGVVTCS